VRTTETAEPKALETTAAESTTPTEPEAETAEVAPTEAAEACDFCHEPGHSFNDCPENREPDYREEVIAETKEIERERA
jgi:hypothetical protein